MSITRTPRELGAAVGGRLLGSATALVAAVRPAAKPLHPRGDVVRGRLTRTGLDEPTGVPWLDEPGEEVVQARLSRAVGLPAFLPDIHGLALRMATPQGHGDVLLASTGTGHVTRFVLTGSRRPGGRPMTTLLPYRAPSGPVLLAAERRETRTWDLAVASPWGSWRHFATLELAEDPGDAAVDFDPVRNTVPGLEVPSWVRRLREPAYRTARRSRAAEPRTHEVR